MSVFQLCHRHMVKGWSCVCSINKRVNMTHLGLMANDYERLTQLVHRPHGIILVTGPTGSGKRQLYMLPYLI
jgi:type II secretory ATPase GspE/PulE/Tfp pilus assembly ATPase PilB-like protein